MKSASTKMYFSTEEEMKAAEVNGTLLCCLTISYSLNIIYIYIYIYISLPFYRTMFLLCLVMLMYFDFSTIFSHTDRLRKPHMARFFCIRAVLNLLF